MSKYALLLLLLVGSSMYPMMLLLELLSKSHVIYLLVAYSICVFVISYQFTTTLYEFCITKTPFRYHLRESWMLYGASVAIFAIYYRFYDQCGLMPCRDYLGVFWALVVSIPIWVNLFYLALECGEHQRYTYLHLIMLCFLTAGGCALLLMVFSLVYSLWL